MSGVDMLDPCYPPRIMHLLNCPHPPCPASHAKPVLPTSRRVSTLCARSTSYSSTKASSSALCIRCGWQRATLRPKDRSCMPDSSDGQCNHPQILCSGGGRCLGGNLCLFSFLAPIPLHSGAPLLLPRDHRRGTPISRRPGGVPGSGCTAPTCSGLRARCALLFDWTDTTEAVFLSPRLPRNVQMDVPTMQGTVRRKAPQVHDAFLPCIWPDFDDGLQVCAPPACTSGTTASWRLFWTRPCWTFVGRISPAAGAHRQDDTEGEQRRSGDGAITSVADRAHHVAHQRAQGARGPLAGAAPHRRRGRHPRHAHGPAPRS